MSQIQQLLWGYFQKELEIVNCNYGQVICMRCQNWSCIVENKESRREELYLSLPIPRRLRADLARYRTTSHSLEIEIGRHYNIARADRLCKSCRRHNVVAVENEIHVMFNCEAYNDIRNLYIDRDALTCANEYNFIKLMNADNTDCIVKLANFVSYMFKIRQQLYDSLQP